MKRYLLLTLAIMAFAMPAFAQDESEPQNLVLPDVVIEQLVDRVLRWYYKPARKPRTVRLADSVYSSTGERTNKIKPEWLPVIRNIRFELVAPTESGYGDRLHFFNGPEKQEKGYSLGFGFGQPECASSGDVWSFRIVKGKVKLTTALGAFGSACGANGGAAS